MIIIITYNRVNPGDTNYQTKISLLKKFKESV